MRLMGTLLLFCVAAAPAGAAQDSIKDPSGKTLAVIVDCNSCVEEKKSGDCRSGVSDGYHDGKKCGECLITANFGYRIGFAYDIQLHGHLKQPDGKPLAGEFVRLYLPNTWTVRTRSGEDGFYRLLLGATDERVGERIVVGLGDRSRAEDSQQGDYALYMLPEGYKECQEEKK